MITRRKGRKLYRGLWLLALVLFWQGLCAFAEPDEMLVSELSALELTIAPVVIENMPAPAEPPALVEADRALYTVTLLDMDGYDLFIMEILEGEIVFPPDDFSWLPEGASLLYWYDATAQEEYPFAFGWPADRDLLLLPRVYMPPAEQVSEPELPLPEAVLEQPEIQEDAIIHEPGMAVAEVMDWAFPTVQEVAPMAAQILGDIEALDLAPLSLATAKGHFGMTVVYYGLQNVEGFMAMDVLLDNAFDLTVDSEGNVYVDISAGGVPHITKLDEDCIAAPNKQVLTCDSHDLSQWGWRTRLEISNPEGDHYIPGELGAIDGTTGQLIGYKAQPGREPPVVYLTYREPVERYIIRYYNRDDEQVSSGAGYALRGSDLRYPPEGVDFGLENGEWPGLVVRGTGENPPVYATAPVDLQLRASECRVTFWVDGVETGNTLTILPGETVDWRLAPSVADGERRAFVGWALQPDGAPVDSGMQVNADIALHAVFDPLHVVNFYAGEGQAPYASVTVRNGQGVDVDAIGIPPLNQRFEGWLDSAGMPFTPGRPVYADLAVYAQWSQVKADISAGVYFHYEAAEAGSLAEVKREFLPGLALHYDAQLDAYYILEEDLPGEVLADLMYNYVSLALDTDSWVWRSEPNGSGYGLTAQNGRWYFQGDFAAEAIRTGMVYLDYRTEYTLHPVKFMDSDGTPLPFSMHVLHGGSMKRVQTEDNVLEAVPKDKREHFTGWEPAYGGWDGWMESLCEPMELMARYRTQHGVSFYAEVMDQKVWYTQLVMDGDSIVWADVPEPELEGSRFAGWYRYDDPNAGLDEPVTAAISFVARYVKQVKLRLQDASGNELASFTLDIGDTFDIQLVNAPVRKGLTFSHWEDTSGFVLDAAAEYWWDTVAKPVYTATVVFMNGDTEILRTKVREGKWLSEWPDVPAKPGYTFVGWSIDFAKEPVTADAVAHAVFEEIPKEKEPESGTGSNNPPDSTNTGTGSNTGNTGNTGTAGGTGTGTSSYSNVRGNTPAGGSAGTALVAPEPPEGIESEAVPLSPYGYPASASWGDCFE